MPKPRPLQKPRTPMQLNVLVEFRRHKYGKGGRRRPAPTHTELALAIGVCRRVAYTHILHLERRGDLQRINSHGKRNYELSPQGLRRAKERERTLAKAKKRKRERDRQRRQLARQLASSSSYRIARNSLSDSSR
jgi:hypothetical protein